MNGRNDTHPMPAIAIIGSRTFNDAEFFHAAMQVITGIVGKPRLIVSCGARGADRLAEQYALQIGVPTTIFFTCLERIRKPRGSSSKLADH
jgi:predicted Rossmann fold nucleotide-binding protein DprA/Smf involved in DNA uptake